MLTDMRLSDKVKTKHYLDSILKHLVKMDNHDKSSLPITQDHVRHLPVGWIGSVQIMDFFRPCIGNSSFNFTGELQFDRQHETV